VTTDFEQAELKAVKTQLQLRDGIIGCFFHWKQCQTRQLKKLSINADIISYIMTSYDASQGTGLLELLTFINPDDIETKGIPYLRKTWKEAGIETGYEEEFDLYWSYFVKTWLRTYKPTDWNIYHLITDEQGNRRATFEGASPEECQLFPTYQQLP